MLVFGDLTDLRASLPSNKLFQLANTGVGYGVTPFVIFANPKSCIIARI